MRIVAGVLLIVIAIFNCIAGSLYTVGGAVTGAGGAAVAEVGRGVAAEIGDKASNLSKLDAEERDAKRAANGLMSFGLFLFALAVMQIGGAVVLFLRKASRYAIAVGALGLLAELAGASIAGGFKWTNGVGVLGSVLCVWAAIGYASNGATPAPARVPLSSAVIP
jgi:hypothetical protein